MLAILGQRDESPGVRGKSWTSLIARSFCPRNLLEDRFCFVLGVSGRNLTTAGRGCWVSETAVRRQSSSAVQGTQVRIPHDQGLFNVLTD